jgi:hypothetical protein
MQPDKPIVSRRRRVSAEERARLEALEPAVQSSENASQHAPESAPQADPAETFTDYLVAGVAQLGSAAAVLRKEWLAGDGAPPDPAAASEFVFTHPAEREAHNDKMAKRPPMATIRPGRDGKHFVGLRRRQGAEEFRPSGVAVPLRVPRPRGSRPRRPVCIGRARTPRRSGARPVSRRGPPGDSEGADGPADLGRTGRRRTRPHILSKGAVSR